jgi:hypothetical protein
MKQIESAPTAHPEHLESKLPSINDPLERALPSRNPPITGDVLDHILDCLDPILPFALEWKPTRFRSVYTDLSSLSLVSRIWSIHALRRLYRIIPPLGYQNGARLMRTIKSNPGALSFVRYMYLSWSMTEDDPFIELIRPLQNTRFFYNIEMAPSSLRTLDFLSGADLFSSEFATQCNVWSTYTWEIALQTWSRLEYMSLSSYFWKLSQITNEPLLSQCLPSLRVFELTSQTSFLLTTPNTLHTLILRECPTHMSGDLFHLMSHHARSLRKVWFKQVSVKEPEPFKALDDCVALPQYLEELCLSQVECSSAMLSRLPPTIVSLFLDIEHVNIEQCRRFIQQKGNCKGPFRGLYLLLESQPSEVDRARWMELDQLARETGIGFGCRGNGAPTIGTDWLFPWHL